MKRLGTIVLTTFLLLTSAVSTHAQITVKPEVTKLDFVPEKILVVGNSYMYFNCGVNSYLLGMIRQKINPKIHARLATIGHSNLTQQPVEELLDNNLLRSHDEEKYGRPSEEMLELEKKQRETYDLVLMQATNRGLQKQKRDAHYIKAHVETIRKAGGTPALIITWTQKRKSAPPLDEVVDAVTEIANANHIMAIPVGQAFAAAEKEHPDWKLLMADKSHPTAVGSYLMAAVIYASIYHRDPTEALAYRGGCEKPLSKEVREEATHIAWKTTSKWFGMNTVYPQS